MLHLKCNGFPVMYVNCLQLVLVSICFIGGLFWLYPQDSIPANRQGQRPEVQAYSITEAPLLDGDVLNDAVWGKIPAFGNLVQSQPNFGRSASEKTAIRIAYTDDTFYVAVVCYDSLPATLVVSDARRDANLDNTDAVIFILDTYKDGQNGFVFGTNSLGVEYDAQVDNEGQGNNNVNRQQGGTIGGFNLNWDASWEVQSLVGEFGWSAEFAIPLRTLRFQSGKDWGFNFRRNIRKSNEIVYWSPLPIGMNINRLSLAGTLTGLELRNPGNLKIIPYVLGRLEKDYSAIDPEYDFTPEAGGDIKYSITPSLTLDATYNTDFAQVEVDDQQVNLDRFNLFFPEKRPFFLENAGLFTVGSPGEVDLFFSRRIGIGADGSVVPIIGGARLSGKLNRTNIGLLSMFTDDVASAGIEKDNFTVARVNHEFRGRSALGALFVNKTSLESSDTFNRTIAVDGKLGLGKKARMSGFYARTIDPNDSLNAYAFKYQADYVWNKWELQAAYSEVGEGFNPEVGFLVRSSFRKPEGRILYHLRSNNPNSPILELRPHISYRGYWNFDNFQETGFLHIDNHWEFKSGLEIHTGLNFTTEGVMQPFEISNDISVLPGTYEHTESQIVVMTNQSKAVSVECRTVIGGAFGGHRYINSSTLRLRGGDKFNANFTFEYNNYQLPAGDFTANILRTQLSYAFTPTIYLQSLVQHNSSDKLWAANLRFGWLQRANTGLFIVYNHNFRDGDPLNQSFIIKYTRMFDLVK